MQVNVQGQVNVEETGEALVITPRFRRLDATVAPAFRDFLSTRIHNRGLVVFALGNIRSMDSSGLGSLVSVLKLLPAGGLVRLAEVSPALEKLLKRTRLHNVLPVFPTVALAVHGVIGDPSRLEQSGVRRARSAMDR
jgi:anti-sigma B factor antagonist